MRTFAHPREACQLFGHTHAERILRGAATKGHLHHAWLLVGASGIGKATLAFRFGRALLAGFPGDLLAVSPQHPVFRLVAAGCHEDLVVLSPDLGEGKSVKTEISIDAVRHLSVALSLTAAAESWRVIIIDGVEALSRNASNALLKILEEPPLRTVFVGTSSTPTRIPHTIRSRCVDVRLLSLGQKDMTSVVREFLSPEYESDLPAIIAKSNGSPGKALRAISSGLSASQVSLEHRRDWSPDLFQTKFRHKIRDLCRETNLSGSGSTIGVRYDDCLDMLRLFQSAIDYNLDLPQFAFEAAGAVR